MIEELRENEIYSAILYAVHKLTKDDKYGLVSELAYTLDRKNFLKLCAVFGGCTLRIPTIAELEIYIKGLLVYELIQKGKPLEVALKEADVDKTLKNDVLSICTVINEVAKEYANK